MEQAVVLGYLPANPCAGVQIPKITRRKVKALEEHEITDFLKTIKGCPYETILKVDLFTGMRQGEIMGLTWDRIDFDAGTILIDRQLIHEKEKGGRYKFAPTKTDQIRKMRPAPFVMRLLFSFTYSPPFRRAVLLSFLNILVAVSKMMPIWQLPRQFFFRSSFRWD